MTPSEVSGVEVFGFTFSFSASAFFWDSTSSLEVPSPLEDSSDSIASSVALLSSLQLRYCYPLCSPLRPPCPQSSRRSPGHWL